VDGDVHQKVVRHGRTDTPEYTEVWAQLRRVQEANQLADAVYTLSDIEGDTAKFAVVSKVGRDGKDFVPVGLGYKLAPAIQPVLRQVLATGTPAYTGIYQSSSGTWITAFAPVRDASLKPVAVLDVDFRADVYLAQLRAVKRRLYLHSLVAALLALGRGSSSRDRLRARWPSSPPGRGGWSRATLAHRSRWTRGTRSDSSATCST
jgi:hypothetical protein